MKTKYNYFATVNLANGKVTHAITEQIFIRDPRIARNYAAISGALADAVFPASSLANGWYDVEVAGFINVIPGETHSVYEVSFYDIGISLTDQAIVNEYNCGETRLQQEPQYATVVFPKRVA